MVDWQQQLPVFSAIIYTQISTVFEAYLDYCFSSLALPLRWHNTQAGIVCVNIHILLSTQHAQNGVRVASVLSGKHTPKLKHCAFRWCMDVCAAAVFCCLDGDSSVGKLSLVCQLAAAIADQSKERYPCTRTYGRPHKVSRENTCSTHVQHTFHQELI